MLRAQLLRYDRNVNEPNEWQAVQTLWESSSQRLRAWLERRTGNSHDAEDLVQETFTRVQERIGALRDSERLDAWVGTIAANVLADHGRKRARQTTPLEDMESSARADQPASCEDASAGLQSAVADWIEAFAARLDDDDAGIIRSIDLEGRAQVDVARELGVAPSTVRSRVQRARSRLRKHLEDCCTFAFDARGSLTDATRRPGSACDCDRT